MRLFARTKKPRRPRASKLIGRQKTNETHHSSNSSGGGLDARQLGTAFRRGRRGKHQRFRCTGSGAKEGSNYEAVIGKNGKQTGVEVSPDGKVVSKHDESKEHKEKGEKY